MLRSTGLRFLVVGLLALVMFIPLFFVAVLIDDRAGYARQAVREVGADWGGAQRLVGPQLVIPVEGPVLRTRTRSVTDPDTGETRTETFEVTETGAKAPLHLYPDGFDVEIATETEERRRGIFRVPVYRAEARMAFDFAVPALDGLVPEGDTVLWERAELRLALTDNRALRGETALTRGGRTLALEPLVADGSARAGLSAAWGDPRGGGGAELVLGFNGAEALQVAPVGRQTAVTLRGDWPHPSFGGRFLPDGSEVGAEGFAATWTIPHLARPLPQAAREDFTGTAESHAFGLTFFQPNDFYQKAFRAARYGILQIGLTFLAVLLIEMRQARKAHPVQYLMIGLVQSVFVLMMVAYAEQIGFGPAYALSAGAVTALLTAYGWAGLGLGRRTFLLGGLLAGLYGVLFLILRSVDYALMTGTTLAFAALAATMWATRGEDWEAAPGRWRRRAAAAGAAGEVPS